MQACPRPLASPSWDVDVVPVREITPFPVPLNSFYPDAPPGRRTLKRSYSVSDLKTLNIPRRGDLWRTRGASWCAPKNTCRDFFTFFPTLPVLQPPRACCPGGSPHGYAPRSSAPRALSGRSRRPVPAGQQRPRSRHQ